MQRFLLLVGLIVLAVSVRAQTAKDYALTVRAEVTSAPPRIMLRWERPADVSTFFVYRRESFDAPWGPEIAIDAANDGYTDNTVEVGKLYEYKVSALLNSGITAYSFITSGIEVRADLEPGSILLLVDQELASQLTLELADYARSLAMEGWRVVRLDIARTESPQAVREKIKNYAQLVSGVKAVILLGRIPVAYSGNLAPDLHDDHRGAWPADVYYGDLDGNWSDGSVNATGATREANRNIPGDGKLDQSELPSDVDVEVGRIDFRNMNQFPLGEVGLLKLYLEKNRRYRRGDLVSSGRTFISDKLGKLAANDIPASAAWRMFPQFVGADRIDGGIWMTDVPSQNYLWAYGAGFGTWFAAEGVGTTEDYAKKDPKAIFTMLFGSYFGDWDSDDNLLRAPIATTTGLASVYGGRPYWYFHPMTMGKSIGFSSKLSQNAKRYLNAPNQRGVHMALMGDPTLQIEHGPKLPGSPDAVLSNGSVTVSWPATSGASSYAVYRGSWYDGPFTFLQEVTTTEYQAAAHPSDTVFMIRPIALRTSATGTYYQAGIGLAAAQRTQSSVASSRDESLFTIEHGRLVVGAGSPGRDVRIRIHDLLGRVASDHSESIVDLSHLSHGSYTIRLQVAERVRSLRILKTHQGIFPLY